MSSFILSVVSLFLIGWASSSLYDSNSQFFKITKNPEPPWEITMNMTPFIFMLAFCILATVIYMFTKERRKKRGSYWLFPFLFSEDDEREKMISDEACRKAFVATWFTAPMIAIALSFYPFIKSTLPSFPIIMVMLIPMVQLVVYFISIRKIL